MKYLEIIKLLIDFGACVDERCFSIQRNKLVGQTFLHWFASQDEFRQRDKQIAEFFICRDANMDAYLEDKFKETPLELTIDKGNVECTEFLLDNSAEYRYYCFLTVF